jgi:AcrR family transcriptional regulator
MSTGPEPARRPSRKPEILERFAELVATRGYDDTSIGDLAEDLGLSKGTIVHHYGSKLALLEQMQREFMTRRNGELEAIVEQVARPADQLAAVIYHGLLVFREDRAASLAATRETVRYGSVDELEGVRRLRREYVAIVRRILERGMESGAFRADDATLVTWQLIGMFNWSWTWFDPDGSSGVEEVAAVFARTVLAGVATRRPAGTVLDDPDGPVPALVRDLVRGTTARYGV